MGALWWPSFALGPRASRASSPSLSLSSRGAVLGAALGFIPGRESVDRCHEVVTTDHADFIAGALIGYLITGPLEAPGFSFSRTGPLGNATFPTFFDTDIHLGVFIAFALVPVVWWLLLRSTLGFEIRTVGANPDAARYAGMRPALLTLLSMSLCGLLAGLAGAGQILGISHFMNASYRSPIGFDSISVRSSVVRIRRDPLAAYLRRHAPDRLMQTGRHPSRSAMSSGHDPLSLGRLVIRRLLRVERPAQAASSRRSRRRRQGTDP